MPRSSVFGRLVILVGIMFAFGTSGPALACPTEPVVSNEPSRGCCDHQGSNGCARSCVSMCQALLSVSVEGGRDVTQSTALQGQTRHILERNRSGPEPPPPRGS